MPVVVPTEAELLKLPAEQLRELRDQLVESFCRCDKETRLNLFAHAKAQFPHDDLAWLWTALEL